MKKMRSLFCYFFLGIALMAGEVSFLSEFKSVTFDTALASAAEVAVRSMKNSRLRKKNNISESHISLEDRLETARFVEQVLKEDRMQNRIPSRLQDPWFLEKHFEWVYWKPNKKNALEKRELFPPGAQDRLDEEILLTKYTIFEVPGSYKKTEQFQYPLYQFVGKKVEPGLTKQLILKGVLQDKKEYEPLVWVSRKGLERALMQGKLIVVMPDQRKRYFTVHLPNGYLYNPKERPYAQKRYWFFKEIIHFDTPEKSKHLSILRAENATFAGDLHAFGRGSFLCLECTDAQKKKKYVLGFLNDTGSMFKNNQYQLDLFVGVSQNYQAFQQKINHLPETAKAYFLRKKRSFA